MLCDNCRQREATRQVRDMDGNIVNLCDVCARQLQGIEIEQVDE